MSQRLAGKTALVTAAAQGIGRATALAFAAEGARVIATDVDQAALAELDAPADHRLETRPLDVTDAAAIATLADDLGAVDVLANIAGYVHSGTILDCSDDDWAFAFDLNVRSMFLTIRTFLPAMIENGGGSIVNMASVSSSLKGIPNRFAYGTSKAAVIGLTKSVARDFIDKRVRCNAICPGTVQSPSLDQRINAYADPEQARKDFIARQPLGRLGSAAEIAAAAVYLAGDESAYTTGTLIVADGGITL